MLTRLLAKFKITVEVCAKLVGATSSDGFYSANEDLSTRFFIRSNGNMGGSVAEWLACWTQAQKGPGSNRSRDAVG